MFRGVLTLVVFLSLTGCGGSGGNDDNQTNLNPTTPIQNTDTDGDGVIDTLDNCPSDANTSQLDDDNDGLGNACDQLTDTDRDGISDALDNCPANANPNQQDVDNDGIGNACDPESIIDDDRDGIENSQDNCISVFNPDQRDDDGDRQGNDCDLTPNGPDSDNDGVGQLLDNCPLIPNESQLDGDANGVGDLCDSGPNGDLDGDSIVNARDVDLTGGVDVNGNGIDDSTEPDEVDSDGDSIVDLVDNCPATSNFGQIDSNGDGIGDACRIERLGACGAEEGTDAGIYLTSTQSWNDNCALQQDGEWAVSGYTLGVQTVLSCLGYTIDIDGYFGPQTKSRVESFQFDNGLEVTGVVSSATWSKLQEQVQFSTNDGERYDRYSVGNNCLVQDFAFDWDKTDIEWEVFTDDVNQGIGIGVSAWFMFSTEPVSYAQ